jgi:hypothetical protein
MTERGRMERRVLRVQVRFEMSRVGAACLADAYEQVVPIARRSMAIERRQPVRWLSERQRRAEGDE